MNTIHKQLKQEHREARLFSKLEKAKETRDRYLARGDKHLAVLFVEPEIQEIEIKIARHMEALKQ